MKKLAFIIMVSSLLSVGAFADHPKGLGVGVVGGANFSSDGSGSDIGLSLKLPSMPIFWALQLSINDSIALGVSGDKYLIDKELLKEGDFRLDWYAGIGGYAGLGIGDVTHASIGARVPIGLSWHITREFELWLGLAPSLGITLAPELNFPDFFFASELGLRIWLK
jgi:hypothetical protein